ncbi:MAG TPA: LysM domain-containing protein, partial [Anaerolineales bacterium]|nr:LysM domain-containing protein [Anaerolineales bacterium]
MKTGVGGGGFAGMVILVFLLVTTACAETSSPATTTPTATRQLTPYWSPTPSNTLASKSIQINSPTPPPTPTPTPVTYQVTKGDTMLGIALRFGVSLEDLLAANPEVDPRFLSVGATLVIPLKVEETAVLITPTPPAVGLESPTCYETADTGAWCFLLVENTQSYALENISAWLNLYSSEGENIRGEMGITPLNLLPAEKSMPVAVFFAPPVPEDFSANGDRFTALAVSKKDERYLNVSVTVDQVEIGPTGLEGRIRGVIELPKKSPPANLLWLVAVAYDDDGKVAGLRKWEAAGNEDGDDAKYVLNSGESLPFEFVVYSLGPEIKRVEVLVEA